MACVTQVMTSITEAMTKTVVTAVQTWARVGVWCLPKTPTILGAHLKREGLGNRRSISKAMQTSPRTEDSHVPVMRENANTYVAVIYIDSPIFSSRMPLNKSMRVATIATT